MMSCAISGKWRLPGIEPPLGFICRFHQHSTPGARLGSLGTAGAAGSLSRSICVRGRRSAARQLPATAPPGIVTSGLRLPLQKSFAGSATTRTPGTPEGRARVSTSLARRFPESIANGQGDCRAVSGSGGDARVRAGSPHRHVLVSIPDDSLEVPGRPVSDDATGAPE